MKKRAGKPPPTPTRNPNRLAPARPAPPHSQLGEGRGAVWGVCLALAAVTLAVFGRTVGYDFVNFDDDIDVYANPLVAGGLTLAGLKAALLHGSSTHWDPVTIVSRMLDCQLYGGHAGGHHLTNVLLHTTSVILLFLVLRQMTGALWRSALVAALFAIHPLRAESVAWVTERKDVLSGLFFMLSLGAYVRYARNRNWRNYVALLVFFALGLMSKAMLVTMPFLLLLLDGWPLNRWRPGDWANARRLLLEKVPLLALAVLIFAATVFAQNEGIHAWRQLTVSSRVANALVSLVVYIRQMFYPAGLGVFYPYPARGLEMGSVIFASLVLGAVTAAVLWWRQSRPYLLVGWLWYVGMLMPVLGLVAIGGQAHADRFTYLPQIGLYVALVWLAESALLPRWNHRRIAFAGEAVLIIAALAAVCVHQLSYWRNSETLWSHTLEVTSDNFLAHYNLGKFLEKKAPTRALEQYQAALSINPDDGNTLQNLGNVLDGLGRTDEALPDLQRAAALQPDNAKAHYNFGNVLAHAGKLDDAIVQLERAVELDPADKMAHTNLGDALYQRGRVEEAIAEFEKAVKLPPDEPQVRCNLGLVLRQQGRVREAAQQFERALAVQPDLALAQSNLRDIAWLLATSPDATTRDGIWALELARELTALPGGRTSANLAAQAAAEAECGQYGPAMVTAQQALTLAAGQTGSAAADNLRKQIAEYQANRPFRDATLGAGTPVHE